ncbi:hypothetical protein Tco_0978584 [Tanacetum coccineum]|uniref:Reverse transcriptase n=1 Tax=Tanacetum coccineum TaxID=301880 RepID=A0ABQ5END3_9ASTR
MFYYLHDSLSHNCMDRETLERQVTLEKIKEVVWDCGSSKAPGPDGYSFAFVKKYWGTIQKDLYDFVNLFFAYFCAMPKGDANSFIFHPYPKSKTYLFIDFRPISLIGIHHLDLVTNGALGLKLVSILRELFYSLLMIALRVIPISITLVSHCSNMKSIVAGKTLVDRFL